MRTAAHRGKHGDEEPERTSRASTKVTLVWIEGFGQGKGDIKRSLGQVERNQYTTEAQPLAKSLAPIPAAGEGFSINKRDGPRRTQRRKRGSYPCGKRDRPHGTKQIFHEIWGVFSGRAAISVERIRTANKDGVDGAVAEGTVEPQHQGVP